jgi:hypothetical protein
LQDFLVDEQCDDPDHDSFYFAKGWASIGGSPLAALLPASGGTLGNRGAAWHPIFIVS